MSASDLPLSALVVWRLKLWAAGNGTQTGVFFFARLVLVHGVRWDRVSAAKGWHGPGLHNGVPGYRRLFVALFKVWVHGTTYPADVNF